MIYFYENCEHAFEVEAFGFEGLDPLLFCRKCKSSCSLDANALQEILVALLATSPARFWDVVLRNGKKPTMDYESHQEALWAHRCLSHYPLISVSVRLGEEK